VTTKPKTIFKLLQAHANEVFNEIPKAVDPVACFAGLSVQPLYINGTQTNHRPLQR
jgi:hypothetical protein